jgi:hypothetical protein
MQNVNAAVVDASRKYADDPTDENLTELFQAVLACPFPNGLRSAPKCVVDPTVATVFNDTLKSHDWSLDSVCVTT